jgi:two-component system, cell cycle sensor histidine kinase and response regulator CckA
MTSLSDTTFLLGRDGQERLERLARTLDAIDQGLQIIGADWRYLYVNSATIRHGRKTRDELLGFTMQQAYPGIEHTQLFATLERCMKERKSDTMINEFDYPDGKKGWFELRVEPHDHGLIIFSIDVTQRKLLEQQYLHAQKLEAVGRLAGGVAHDFNNLLSVILSYTQLVLDELPTGEHREDLLEVFSAAERATELTRQLLAFSRNQVMQPRFLDLNALVAGLSRMLKPLVGEDVLMRLDTAKEPLLVRADPGLVEQVVMNLVVNGRDAMPAGGELVVQVRRTDTGAELSVRDHGTGMDASTRERIFEPFFTTKELGKGTGLGLSTVFGIVSQLGGTVSVESELGKGSTFLVTLPLAPPGSKVTEKVVKRPLSQGPTGQSVLVVDDDPQLLGLACTVMKQGGYVVSRARTGAEALEVAAGLSELHLVITDVVMPGMSGSELARQLRAVRPGLPVLFMSGYADDGVIRQRDLEPDVELVEKPILPDRLLERVRRLLPG